MKKLTRFNRRQCAAWLAGAAALIFAGAAAAQPLNPPVKIRMNSAGIVGETPLYYALEKGYFKAEGIDLEIILAQANSAGDTLAMLSSGELEASSFALSAGWLNAVDRGIPVASLIALNTLTADDRAAGVVVRKDHIDSGRYKGPKDFKGMKVASFSLGGQGHYLILQAMKKGGLSANDIELVTLGPPDVLTALANKSIDAAFSVDPFIGIMKARGLAEMVATDGELSPGVPSIVLHVNKAFAERNKEAVQRFVNVVLRAIREYDAAVKAGGEAKTEMLKALQARGTIKDMKMLENISMPTVDLNGKFDTQAFMAQQQFFVDTGSMKKTVPVDKVFDFSFLNAALAKAGTR